MSDLISVARNDSEWANAALGMQAAALEAERKTFFFTAAGYWANAQTFAQAAGFEEAIVADFGASAAIARCKARVAESV